MTNIFHKIKSMGYIKATRLIAARLTRYLLLPQWYIYKLRNYNFKFHDVFNDNKNKVTTILGDKEHFIQAILSQSRGKKFLEIGIGEFPNIERINLMVKNNIQYTACDFEAVCISHKKELEIRNIDTQWIRFASNRVGTYCWTLFEMLSKNEQFDVIYLDGHHTFYIDLPAVFLAHHLLRPGGYLLVDDIQWTCNFLKNNMLHTFNEWYFYHKMYDLSVYEPEQQDVPHIKMIAEEVLLNRLGYFKKDEYSIPQWWTLQKPLT